MRRLTRRKRKSAYHHGNLRAALIECGLQLIEEKGLRALTLREIGSRLGVSRSAAYRHFADKAALLSAISEAGFIEFGSALEAARDSAPFNASVRLQAMGIAYVRFASRHRAHFEVMFATPLEPGCPAAQAGDRAFGILEKAIRDGQQSGEFRQGDPVMLARAVWAMVHGISMLQLERDFDDPQFTRFASEILKSGIQCQVPELVSPEPLPEAALNR